MPYAWQSVEEAAVTLGVSTRTLHRRISKGEVETRLDDGRREVLVCLPDAESEELADEVEAPVSEVTGSPEPPQMNNSQAYQPSHSNSANSFEGANSYGGVNSTAIVLAQKEVALANEKVRRTELALAAFQHTSALLEREAWRTRISARLAWAAVASLAVGVYIAVGWTATQVTRHKTDNEHLIQQVKAASSTLDQRETEVSQLRDKLSKAEQLAAHSQGELEATKASMVRKPATTQPGLLERMAKVLIDP